jgi:hypothetical protein
MCWSRWGAADTGCDLTRLGGRLVADSPGPPGTTVGAAVTATRHSLSSTGRSLWLDRKHLGTNQAKIDPIFLRVTIPSRTKRHQQAAVHSLWHTGKEKETVFFGFRKREQGWVCTASKLIR